MMRSRPVLFLAGLAVALLTPAVLGLANAALPPVGLVVVYAALGGLCAWLLADERRRPLGLGILLGGGLFVLSLVG